MNALCSQEQMTGATDPLRAGASQSPNLQTHRLFLVALLLLAWFLRLGWLDDVPPGWRDDELINIHALSGQVLAGEFPIYFTGASGHEPLYHYLHAGVHAVLGFNVLSAHILSAAFGLLSVALTYTLARRLFGRRTAAIAALGLAFSFWSLMYSRTAIRHISLPPLALLVFYLLWRLLQSDRQAAKRTSLLLGLALGGTLYTYFASRLLPAIIVVFGGYLWLFHRSIWRQRWRHLLLALFVAGLVVAPMAWAIAHVPGADARLGELALPVNALRAGDAGPLLTYTVETLGMFHATGDPEYLYNIPGRPVFNGLGAALLWAGVFICLYRWRHPRYFFLLLWLGSGLSPAFLSVPPSSLGHTILAQPAAYILPALALVEFRKCARFFPVRLSFLILIFFLGTNAARDLHDYFIVWPRLDMVRLLYRADYRDTARYLNAHPELDDVTVASALRGPWDRLALEVDTRHAPALRLFDPQRALVWTANGVAETSMFLPGWPEAADPLVSLIAANTIYTEAVSERVALHRLALPECFTSCGCDASVSLARFANNLTLRHVEVEHERHEGAEGGEKKPGTGETVRLLTVWEVAAPLDLPPEPSPPVANPPPPGVYSGPRLQVFVHLLAGDGRMLAGDDGLWVDPLTLQVGDCFVHAHHIAAPESAPPGSYHLVIGLYDKKTGQRWPTLDADGRPVGDVVFIDVE